MTVAIVVGHRESSQGASLCTNGLSEWWFNRGLANALRPYLRELEIEADVLLRPDRKDGLTKLCKSINKTGYSLAVELHFNSHGSPEATGTETLCHETSTRGAELAKAVQAEMVKALGLTDRGIKPRGPKARGGAFLSKTSMPAIIVEPFFGSNRSDCKTMGAARLELARAIAVGIATHLP